MIVVALFFVIGAVIIHIIIKGKAISPESMYNVVYKGFCFGLALEIIYYTLKTVSSLSKKNRWERYLSKMGYCDEFYNKIREKLNKKSDVKAFKLRLFLAKQLCDGERYDEALCEMKSIVPESVENSQLGNYYAHYFYVFVMSYQLDDAEKILEMGKEYISRTQLGLLSMGIYNYAIGQYAEAEDFLLDISVFCDRHIKITAKMFVALCYLKCDKKDEAKELVCGLIPEVSNPVLKKNLAKLMKLVEIAYGVSPEQNTEESEGVSQDAGSVD